MATDAKPDRPRRRWHRSTSVLFASMVLLWVFVNWPQDYSVYTPAPHFAFGAVHWGNLPIWDVWPSFRAGWPSTYWARSPSGRTEWWGWALVSNVAVAVTVTTLLTAAFEWRRRRRGRLLQLSLLDLFASIAVAALI